MIQDLSRQMKISLKKHILDKNVKQKIYQIQRITSRNGKIEYCGWTHAKNGVVLQPVWIRDYFKFR